MYGLHQYADDSEGAGFNPHWQGQFTLRDDYATLTPLIWELVNPYGRFYLDMNTGLDLP